MKPDTSPHDQDEALDAPAPEPNGIRHMPAILGELQGGMLYNNMASELSRVVRDVANCQTGKGGSVTLELKVERLKKQNVNSGRAIILQATLKSKSPDDPPDANIFFFDDTGGLHLRDPDQHDLFSGPRG